MDKFYRFYRFIWVHRGSSGFIGRVACCAAVALWLVPVHTQERPAGQGFSFKTSVELINVNVSVSDANNRFVPGLRKEDFIVYEDGRPQTVSQFESERVPVSLGIDLDTSGSMFGEKMSAAQSALNRFLFDLLGSQDEVFLYRFDARPELVQPWTTDRRAVSRALGAIQPRGGTAMYDAIAESVPMAQTGTRRKKALLLISDGNDTGSRTPVSELRQLIRETEVLVYAIGIDGSGQAPNQSTSRSPGTWVPPISLPIPGRRGTIIIGPSRPSAPPPSRSSRNSGERVNADALREITDDSGGRTEIIYSNRDLDPATAGIADELSQQYFLGYVSSLKKDGRWHTIDVQVRRGNYTVRARKGFIANQ